MQEQAGADNGTSDFRSLSSGEAGETQARRSRSRGYAGDDDCVRAGGDVGKGVENPCGCRRKSSCPCTADEAGDR